MNSKILVIEDERSIRRNLVKFLESEGFEPLEAENGRIGVDLAQKYLPELIICDILMPELDGYQVLTSLQQEEKTAAIPFIFLTSSTNQADLRQSMELGADDYLSKPVTSEQLRSAIATRLKKHQNIIKQYSQDSREVENLEKRLQQLEKLLSSKNNLLKQVSERLRNSLEKSVHILEISKNSPLGEEKDRYLEKLQQEFARMITLINQVYELQKFLTPENAQLLEQFNFLNNETQEIEAE